MLMLEAVIQAQAIAMEADKGEFAFGEDVGKPGGVFGPSKGLQEKFGATRVLDTPIATQALIGAGVRPALVALRPLAATTSNRPAGVFMAPHFHHAANHRVLSADA